MREIKGVYGVTLPISQISKRGKEYNERIRQAWYSRYGNRGALGVRSKYTEKRGQNAS